MCDRQVVETMLKRKVTRLHPTFQGGVLDLTPQTISTQGVTLLSTRLQVDANIRDLFGHKIDLNLVRSHPIVRWDVDDPDAKKASAELD